MKWRLLVGAATTIALGGAVALGADAAVAGVDRASGLAVVIAGFCELTAFVLGVTGWAAKRRTAVTSAGLPDVMGAGDGAAGVSRGASDDAGGSAKYVVDASDARGLQIGDQNFQRNDFRRAAPGGDQDEAADGG